MKKNISAILVALYLIVGCSSGGGTSGAGGIGSGTTGNILISATLTPQGIFNVTIVDIAVESELSDTGLPTGIILETYTVSYVAQKDENAPALTPRSHSQTVPMINGVTTAAIPVILAGAITVHEFDSFNPNPGFPKTYTATVNYTGRSLAGERIAVSAATAVTFSTAVDDGPVVPPDNGTDT